MRPSVLRSSVLALGILFAGTSAFAAHRTAPAPAPAPHVTAPRPVSPMSTISKGYQTRLIKAAAGNVTGQVSGSAGTWKVASVPAPHGTPAGPNRHFEANFTWGSGIHPMVMVPTVKGTINIQKAPQAPQGAARVNVTSPPSFFP